MSLKVKVRPLVWVQEEERSYEVHRAATPWGSYHVYDARTAFHCVLSTTRHDPIAVIGTRFLSSETAKKAAQKDHVARVLLMVEAAP